jgi:hypothetical protein
MNVRARVRLLKATIGLRGALRAQHNAEAKIEDRGSSKTTSDAGDRFDFLLSLTDAASERMRTTRSKSVSRHF